jgi:hypothetical protein
MCAKFLTLCPPFRVSDKHFLFILSVSIEYLVTDDLILPDMITVIIFGEG